jgi:hypothetical protein
LSSLVTGFDVPDFAGELLRNMAVVEAFISNLHHLRCGKTDGESKLTADKWQQQKTDASQDKNT